MDCAARGGSVAAVGVCTGCGAAVCIDHVVLSARVVSYAVPGGVIPRWMPAAVPARTLRCGMCAEAEARRDTCE